MSVDITSLNVFINGILRQGNTTGSGSKSYVSSGTYYEFLTDDRNDCVMRVADYDGAFNINDEVIIYTYGSELNTHQNRLWVGRVITKTQYVPNIFDITCSSYIVEITTEDTKNLTIIDNTILQNNEINTAEFDHHDTILNQWREGQEIIIYRPNLSTAKWDGFKWGAEKWSPSSTAYIYAFRGRITSVETERLRIDTTTPANSEYNFHYSCSDFRCDLNDRLVKATFSEQGSKSIISYILGIYMIAEGWDNYNYIDDVTVTGGIDFDYISVFECLNKIANVTGYVWYIGTGTLSKTVHFKLPSTLTRPAPIELLDSGTEFYNLRIKRDFSQIATRTYCRGGYTDSGVNYRQPTSGTVTPGAGDTDINLDFLPAQISPTSFHIYINSVEDTNVGVYGLSPADTTSHFLIDYKNGILYVGTYNSGSFIGTETVYMTYNKAIPLITMAEDTTYQDNLANLTNTKTGIREVLIDNNELLGGSPANGTDNATANYRELTIRKEPIVSGTFNVLDSIATAWASGQTLHIDMESRGFDSATSDDIYVTITKVTTAFIGGNAIEYTIEFDSQVYTLNTTLKKLVQATNRTVLTEELLVNI